MWKLLSLLQKNLVLVIMGTHGHGKLEKAIIGSVASEVVRTCPKPVMVVRLPDESARSTEAQAPGKASGRNDKIRKTG